MTTIQSPFTELFIDALKQQYTVACRSLNHRGIRDILLSLGFSPEETDELFVLATMNQNDMEKDKLVTVQDAISKMKEHDISCVCSDCLKKKA